MKVQCLLLFSLVLASSACAQTSPPQVFDPVTSREFLKQLVEDGVYNFISSKVAEGLVIHRVDPVLPHGDMMPRVSGTVIIAFEITKDGKVRRAMAVSGPKLLQPPVLAAVRQWTFKPYPLHGEPTTVATSIPLTVSNF
jgi:TonB family protein